MGLTLQENRPMFFLNSQVSIECVLIGALLNDDVFCQQWLS